MGIHLVNLIPFNDQFVCISRLHPQLFLTHELNCAQNSCPILEDYLVRILVGLGFLF